MNPVVSQSIQSSDTAIFMFAFWRIILLIVFLASVTLICKYLLGLKWLISICIAVILLSIFSLFGIDIGLFGHSGLGLSRLVILFPTFVCIVILIVKLFQWIFSTSAAQQAVNPQERSRILKLVEDGKINANEGKELIDVMGKSSALQGEEKFSRLDFAFLAGVGLVVLGFFLPWVYIRTNLSIVLGSPLFALGEIKAYQAGYQTDAIGWSIFFIAIASAIPVFVTPRNLLYKISMLQIFLNMIGAVIVISLLTRVDENLGAGLVFCLLGFMTAFFASLAKFKSLAA